MFASGETAIPTVRLGDLIKVRSGDALVIKDHDPDGKFPVYGGNGINGYHSKYLVGENTIVLGRVGVYCGAVHVTRSPAWVTDNAVIVEVRNENLITEYLAAALTFADLNQYAGRSAQPLISGSRIYPVNIPLPPIALQKQFGERVSEIDKISELQHAHLAKLDAIFSSLQLGAFQGEF